MPQHEEAGVVLPPGTECITRSASNMDLLQVAMKHPQFGWIAVELNRRAASLLASELQSFVDYRSTPDVDA